MIGKQLQHYKIIRQLGSGGMGEVYVAEDTKLQRKVALKVLPSEMAGDPERRARFEREARAIAALNHPNIVTIHSVEEADGVHFITMELVQGQTLSELIPGHGFALSRFFELTILLADAVSAAHQQGITHRDLKPDNVMVSDEGRVKILDFGLAKLREETSSAPEGSQFPTTSVTAEGKILGTVAYMSPEQAEGKPIDHRSDIFSLGVLLHQMATGQRPFRGDTSVSIVSSILRDTPQQVHELNQSLPRHLGRIVRHCLYKDTERRYQSAKDLRNDLQELKEEVDSGEALPPGAVAGVAARRWGGGLLYAVLAAVVIVILGTIWLKNREAPREASTVPLSATFTRLTSQPGAELFPSLSPDGRSLVYASAADGDWDIYLQRVGGEKPINLTEDSTDDDSQPAYSPDGDSIVFRSEREGGGVFVMGATGESVKRLADFGHNPAWSPDGTKVLVASEGVADPHRRFSVSELWILDVSTGERRRISEGDAVQPSWSPNGLRIAYWGLVTGKGQRDIWTLSADGGDVVPVTTDDAVDWNPVWSPDGEYLYFSSDRGGSMNLWRVPIGEGTGQLQGGPEPVTTGATASREHSTLSEDGRRIAYVESLVTGNVHRVSLDPDTLATGQSVPVTSGSMRAARPERSPDGEWIAFHTEGVQEDLFVVRADGTGRRQLTDDPYKDRRPTWSPDGSRIAFYSNRGGSYELWTINPDGSQLEQLTDTPGEDSLYTVWSPDGSRIAYQSTEGRQASILDLTRPWSEQTPELLPAYDEPGGFSVASWSPDGRWIAGWSSRGLVLYSLEDRSYRRVTDSGERPKWLPDSERLLFWDAGKIVAVDTRSGEPWEILSLDPPATIGSPFGVAPDGRSIVFIHSTSESDVWMLELEGG